MKIDTLLEIIDTEVSDRTYSGTFKTNFTHYPNQLGMGFYSKVVDDKEDPHFVKKYNHRFDNSRIHDGFVIYAEAIIRYKLYDNPFFPRIYKHNKTHDSHGKVLHSYQIERLYPLKQLSLEEIKFLYSQLFNDGENIIEEVGGSSATLDTLISVMVNIISDSIRATARDIKNPDLLNAVNIISSIVNACSECFLDLCANNVMFRRSPYGVQLVITDPIA